jgi:hypothetical protein
LDVFLFICFLLISQGFVWVQMDSAESAAKVVAKMNGRAFNKRTLAAEFVTEAAARAKLA